MNSDDYFDDNQDSFLYREAAILEANALRENSKQTIHSVKAAKPPVANVASEDDFGDDSAFFNDDVLKQLDAMETAALIKAKPVASASRLPPKPVASSSKHRNIADTSMDFTFDDIGALEFAQIDAATSTAYKQTGPPRSQIQTTLDGGVLATQTAKPRAPMQRTKSTGNGKNPFGQKPQRTKVWDYGAKIPQNKRQKRMAQPPKEAPDAEEFEEFPNPEDELGEGVPTEGMKHEVDVFEARFWIFPSNREKRDYQYNIAQASLFDNTLVAIPTGMGKTFIASVVMLNYYRWFPTGKIIFIAPTKPLVAQQIYACHECCGIPGSDAAEITGEVTKESRSRKWMEKRIFYMTSQTFVNGIREYFDPRDVVLLVIDEAHRGTGNHSYVQAVRAITDRNPHFRILALTATPGNRPETVQEIVNGLHISHIEMRDERSMDLKPYMLKKNIDQHTINLGDPIRELASQLGAIMQPLMKRLLDARIIFVYDPLKLTAGGCVAALQNINNRPDARQLKWATGPLLKLQKLSRILGNLMECSYESFYSCLTEITTSTEPRDYVSKSIKGDIKFKQLMGKVETIRARGWPVHPKMEKLKALAIEHFAQAAEDAKENGASGNGTKMMVFASYRELVEHIVDFLNTESPLLRASRFVGQSVDKAGKKGITQKEQQEIIDSFKNGDFNILVSTSVGEEGLDIGEIDMILCYDASDAPHRTLQRIGRTGRKREGHVALLATEGREEEKWSKAQEKYADVQQAIHRGTQVELYGDVPRLLPAHIRPECRFEMVDIEKYDRARVVREDAAAKALNRGVKWKRAGNNGRKVPKNALTEFVYASKLHSKSRKTGESVADQMDDDDADLLLAGSSRASKVGVPKTKRQTRAPKKASQSKLTLECTSSQIDRAVESDSSAGDIGDIMRKSTKRPTRRRASSSSSESDSLEKPQKKLKRSSPPIVIPSSPERPLAHQSLTAQASHCFKRPTQKATQQPTPHVPTQLETGESWLHSDSDDAGPSATFAVKAPGQFKRPRLPMPEIAPRMRLHRRMHCTSSSVDHGRSPLRVTHRTKEKSERPKSLSKSTLVCMDLEAAHSGDEVSEGSSGTEDEEDETDRRFLQPLAETQLSPSYDQSQVYRLSLATQIPQATDMPVFARGPVRIGRFASGRMETRVVVSSSPSKASVGDYEHDSFVVSDSDGIMM